MVSVSHVNAQELPDRDVNCTLGGERDMQNMHIPQQK